MSFAYQRQQQRSDLAVNMAATNVIPLMAEIWVESDTLLFKIGNGVAYYRDLPYAVGGGGGGGGAPGVIDGGTPTGSSSGFVDGGSP